jgi:hypothetical protein
MIGPEVWDTTTNCRCSRPFRAISRRDRRRVNRPSVDWAHGLARPRGTVRNANALRARRTRGAQVRQTPGASSRAESSRSRSTIRAVAPEATRTRGGVGFFDERDQNKTTPRQARARLPAHRRNAVGDELGSPISNQHSSRFSADWNTGRLNGPIFQHGYRRGQNAWTRGQKRFRQQYSDA